MIFAADPVKDGPCNTHDHCIDAQSCQSNTCGTFIYVVRKSLNVFCKVFANLVSDILLQFPYKFIFYFE